MKKAAFIDLDGTIFDSERVYQRFWEEAIAGAGFDPFFCDTLKLRSADRELATSYLRSVYGPGIDVELVRKLRDEEMKEWLEENRYEVKPGVIQGLVYLRSKGIMPYIVTATPKEKAMKTLSEYGLLSYFEDVISAKDVAHGKPAPDCYLKAIAEAKVAPEEGLAIEDAPNGIEAALAAGLDTYMVPDLSEPDETMKARLKGVLRNFNEIRRYL